MAGRRRQRRWPQSSILALPLAALVAAGVAGEEVESGSAGLSGEALAELRALRADVAEVGRRLDRFFERYGAGPELLERLGEGSGGDSAGSSTARLPVGEADDPGLGDLVRVDVRNTEWMKEVLFGGAPWVLHCVDSRSSAPTAPPPVLVESARELRSMATFGLVDCWERMESGKTLAHRFDFPKPPVTFAVANGDPPAVIDLEGSVKPWQVRRKAGPHLSAGIERIDGPERFKQYCTSRRACLVVGFKSAPMLAAALRTLTPLLEQVRGVRAVAVDTSVWKVKLDDKLAATKPAKRKADIVARPGRASLMCLARLKSGSSRGGAFFSAPGDDLDAGAVEDFLRRCDGGRSLVEFAKVPLISQRPPEAPKYSSPSGKAAASGQQQQQQQRRPDGKARGSRPKSAKTRGKGSRADVVGSRQALEEEEPTFETVDDDEAQEMEKAAKQEEDSAWEEVEL